MHESSRWVFFSSLRKSFFVFRNPLLSLSLIWTHKSFVCLRWCRWWAFNLWSMKSFAWNCKLFGKYGRTLRKNCFYRQHQWAEIDRQAVVWKWPSDWWGLYEVHNFVAFLWCRSKHIYLLCVAERKDSFFYSINSGMPEVEDLYRSKELKREIRYLILNIELRDSCSFSRTAWTGLLIGHFSDVAAILLWGVLRTRWAECYSYSITSGIRIDIRNWLNWNGKEYRTGLSELW